MDLIALKNIMGEKYKIIEMKFDNMDLNSMMMSIRAYNKLLTTNSNIILYLTSNITVIYKIIHFIHTCKNNNQNPSDVIEVYKKYVSNNYMKEKFYFIINNDATTTNLITSNLDDLEKYLKTVKDVDCCICLHKIKGIRHGCIQGCSSSLCDKCFLEYTNNNCPICRQFFRRINK